MSFLICRYSISLSRKYNFVNKPKEERISDLPIPLSGGSCIYISFMLSSLLFFDFPSALNTLIFLYFLMYIIGLLDDVLSLGSLTKFSFPLILAAIAVFYDFRANIFDSIIFNSLISLFFIYGIVNAFNFIDNLDGVSSVNAIISYLGLVILSLITEQENIFYISLLLLSSTAAFFLYNFPEAEIYAGDSGSLLFGFTISTLLLHGSWSNESLDQHSYSFVLLPILVVGYPIFDVTYVFFHRILNNFPPWRGDTNHSSHKLLKMGYSKKQTLLVLTLISLFIVSLSILVYYTEFVITVVIFSIVVMLLIYFTFFLNKIPYDLPNN